jgi:hypothetical protein
MALGFVKEVEDLSDSLFESESAVWTFRRFMVRGAVEGSFDSFAPAESQGSFRAISGRALSVRAVYGGLGLEKE